MSQSDITAVCESHLVYTGIVYTGIPLAIPGGLLVNND